MRSKMTLPTTTRGSETKNFLPNNGAMVKAIQVARTAESARYLEKTHAATVARFGPAVVENTKGMSETLKEHSRNMELKESATSDCWAGKMPKSGNKNYWNAMANTGSEALRAAKLRKIKFEFALNDSSQFLRAFTANGKPLDTKHLLQGDYVLNGFLVDNDYYTEVTEKGTFVYTLDENNNRIKADPEKVRELLTKNEKGFQEYLKEKHELDATIESRPYPEEAPAPAEPEKRAPKVAAEAPPTPGEGASPSSTT